MNEPLDLTIALKKLHELAQEEGDLGYAYWYAVAQLLKDAQRLRELESLLSKNPSDTKNSFASTRASSK